MKTNFKNQDSLDKVINSLNGTEEIYFKKIGDIGVTLKIPYGRSPSTIPSKFVKKTLIVKKEFIDEKDSLKEEYTSAKTNFDKNCMQYENYYGDLRSEEFKNIDKELQSSCQIYAKIRNKLEKFHYNKFVSLRENYVVTYLQEYSIYYSQLTTSEKLSEENLFREYLLENKKFFDQIINNNPPENLNLEKINQEFGNNPYLIEQINSNIFELEEQINLSDSNEHLTLLGLVD